MKENSGSESHSYSKLGEGAFGCVLKPPVKCSTKEKNIGKQKNNSDLVGKIFFDKTDFNTELKISKKVAKIDKTGSTLLIPKSSCAVKKNDVYKNPKTNECSIFEEQIELPSKMYQLIMPYGGERLDYIVEEYFDYHMKKMSVSQFLLIMKPILDGLHLLKKHKSCHQDIKIQNILVTPQNKAIIIDYGLMKPYKDIFSLKNKDRLKHTYFPYPFEYKLFYYLHIHHCKYSKETCDTELYYNALRNISKHDKYKELYMNYFTEKELDIIIKELIERYYKLEEKNKLKDYLYSYVEKVDIYSVGICFVYLHDVLAIESLPSKDYEKYKEFVRLLIHPDIEKRLTIEKAQKLLKNLI